MSIASVTRWRTLFSDPYLSEHTGDVLGSDRVSGVDDVDDVGVGGADAALPELLLVRSLLLLVDIDIDIGSGAGVMELCLWPPAVLPGDPVASLESIRHN